MASTPSSAGLVRTPVRCQLAVFHRSTWPPLSPVARALPVRAECHPIDRAVGYRGSRWVLKDLRRNVAGPGERIGGDGTAPTAQATATATATATSRPRPRQSAASGGFSASPARARARQEPRRARPRRRAPSADKQDSAACRLGRRSSMRYRRRLPTASGNRTASATSREVRVQAEVSSGQHSLTCPLEPPVPPDGPATAGSRSGRLPCVMQVGLEHSSSVVGWVSSDFRRLAVVSSRRRVQHRAQGWARGAARVPCGGDEDLSRLCLRARLSCGAAPLGPGHGLQAVGGWQHAAVPRRGEQVVGGESLRSRRPTSLLASKVMARSWL